MSHARRCRSVPRRRPARVNSAALGLITMLLLTGCASSSRDSMDQGGTYTFVSPGGQTQFFYDPPASRGTVGTLSGQSLTRPDTATSLNDYRDQIVVLNLWGSWCAPCRTETPDLEQTATATRSDGVQLLGINVKDSRTAAADYVRNREVSYPSIYDPAGRTMLALRGIPRSVVPLTIVLDRHHRVAAVFLTTVTADELIATVQRLAAEK